MMTPFAAATARVRDGADPHVEARILVAEMTVEEKLSCLDGDTPCWEGLLDSLLGGYYQHPYPAAVMPRLGVPGIQFSDGPRGVVVGHCTAFPVSMARGATFDPTLEERIGDAIGKELRAQGATFYGGVCVNLLRHPAWGRAQETYGEDPLHVGEMGAALARGVQRHAMACVKHFACNSMENARFTVDVTAGERALHEVYLAQFKRVIDEGVASVMSAYNSLNGEWCGQNRTLLTTILRDEWGFDGLVVSDFQFGLRDAVRSVEAGLDIEMPYVQQRAQHLPGAVGDGRLPIALVDAAAERVVATLLRFAPVVEAPGDAAVLVCDAHRALAREAAQKSIVLLRNQGGFLPLDELGLRRVAVLGRLAVVPNLGDGGSSDVHPPHVVTPLDGLRATLPGSALLHDAGTDLAQARALAEDADVAVVVVGYTKHDEGEYIDVARAADLMHLFPPLTDPTIGERLQKGLAQLGGTGTFAPGGDRRSLTLAEGDEVLIEAIAAVNPRTVAVVMGGSAVVLRRWRQRVPAILLLWYPGMEGGHALADVLLGRVNPSGRLPFVIPTEPSHLPDFDREATTATYDLWHGQWRLDRDGLVPAYPFGFGLSYTGFALSGLAVDGHGLARTVRVTVTNRGVRDGAEVVQVYGGVSGSRFERPQRRLVGFARLEVPAGAARTVAVRVDLRTLAVRERGEWVVERGRYDLTVARYAGDPDALRGSVEV